MSYHRKRRPGDHALRQRVGRFSWFDRTIVTYHAPEPIFLAVSADFRILIGCAVKGCTIIEISA